MIYPNSWIEVKEGEPSVVMRHYNDVLMLCWPDYNNPMAYKTLKLYQGNRLIYIGEGEGGCTGDDDFHQLLDDEWTEVEHNVLIPQWWGIHDELRLYTRK